MDRGRFERLEKTTGKPQRDDILLPRAVAVSAGEAQHVRYGERFAVEIGEQQRHRLVVAHVERRIDMAVAEAMLERDAPLPARRARGRAGERRAIAPPRAGNCARTVAGQPGGPVGIADAERLPEEQRAQARAVDDATASHQRKDETTS